jgi:hypothetical protein
VHAALQGRVTTRHRFLLRLHLRQIDTLDVALAEIDEAVDHDLDPFRDAVRRKREFRYTRWRVLPAGA